MDREGRGGWGKMEWVMIGRRMRGILSWDPKASKRPEGRSKGRDGGKGRGGGGARVPPSLIAKPIRIRFPRRKHIDKVDFVLV